MDRPPPPRSVTSVWPAVVLLAVALGMLVWAQGYGPTAARFPTMVAGAMGVLALFDIWSRSALPGRRMIETFWGASFGRREMDHDPPLRDQAALVAWVLACFAGMAAIGILAAAPLFCAAFVRLRGRRSATMSLGVGLAVLAFQFAVFEWLLDYELYRGLLLTKGGLAAW